MKLFHNESRKDFRHYLGRISKEIGLLAVIFCGVFSFKSSVAESYFVPTGSMTPSIRPGEFLLVSKLSYDLKVPFSDRSLRRVHEPERGDVIVFRYPRDPSTYFVKRLVGLPGDEIVVEDGFVRINGVPLSLTLEEKESLEEFSFGFASAETFKEQIGEAQHSIQRLVTRPKTESLKFKVPSESFFFMGDNRDDSHDSRAWGFVPRSHLKGKALYVWFSLDKNKLLPRVRWDRIGTQL